LTLDINKTYILNLSYKCKIPGQFIGVEIVNEAGVVDYYENNGDASKWHKDGQSKIYLNLGPSGIADFCQDFLLYHFKFERAGTARIRVYASDKFDPTCLEINASELVFMP
jgi:hypothetical protein